VDNLKIKALEVTLAFYGLELKKEDLTFLERSKYLSASKSIKRIISEKKRTGEKNKHINRTRGY